MGRDSKISWTDSTWNPWIGCHKVSPGCKNCYAETLVENRMGRKFSEIRRASPATFNAPLRWNSILGDYETGDMHYVFTCSISDFFIEEADAWRDEAWDIIRRTPHLTYQILTKRPERIAEHLPKMCFSCGVSDTIHAEAMVHSHGFQGWPWSNVWLGTSIETQQFAEKRIPILTCVPAKVHFLSCEPLLGRIDFYMDENHWEEEKMLKHIQWVIAGGESGPDFRKMDLDWARSIRDQCKAASVPFFFKQGNGLRSETPCGDPALDSCKEMPR